ncbi:MAG: anthranilate phosphoribosyltransferase [Chloroflexi bacterium]|nr:anthranilate phosphoribosyltransferase [Chloroflexota bacterium]
MIRQAISRVVAGNDLSEDEARSVMTSIMSEEVTPAQFASLVTALRIKGEVLDEIVGFASVMRDRAVPVRADGVGMVIDTCGTGGDGIGTFNVSTAAAIVVAAGGYAVAKHGNRAASSRCGSADVLEALGVHIGATSEQVTAGIERIGIAFMLAPLYHPATKFAVSTRKEIGIRTVFNILGPLTNPARVKGQVLGVATPALVPLMAGALQRLGSRHALVVSGADGLDELSISGPTFVCELHKGTLHNYEVTPEQVGLRRAPLQEVLGGSAEENAAILRSVFANPEPGARRDIVALNAGAGLLVCEVVDDLAEGVSKAIEIMESGKAMEKLEQWIRFTQWQATS